ncbi:unnamed protein product [Oikopleura dioica]|uniref:Uncharacterized protein n=1 Tax=Oikopleura dioica TaxID=34765 RepID=E4XCP0_OIKDI|nr:unnamed protein product [Oikopleura dioica]
MESVHSVPEQISSLNQVVFASKQKKKRSTMKTTTQTRLTILITMTATVTTTDVVDALFLLNLSNLHFVRNMIFTSSTFQIRSLLPSFFAIRTCLQKKARSPSRLIFPMLQ